MNDIEFLLRVMSSTHRFTITAMGGRWNIFGEIRDGRSIMPPDQADELDFSVDGDTVSLAVIQAYLKWVEMSPLFLTPSSLERLCPAHGGT